MFLQKNNPLLLRKHTLRTTGRTPPFLEIFAKNVDLQIVKFLCILLGEGSAIICIAYKYILIFAIYLPLDLIE